MYHHSYSHNTVGCRDLVKHPNTQRRNNYPQKDKTPRQGQQLDNGGASNSNKGKPSEGEKMMMKDLQKVIDKGRAPQSIREIDTIFRDPYVGKESRNVQRNYARKAKDPKWRVL